jgi:hypothetical protein
MGDGRIFLKNHRASSFNKDLSNGPNFGQIHLAGQSLMPSSQVAPEVPAIWAHGSPVVPTA